VKRQRSWLILVAASVPLLWGAGTAFGDSLLYDFASGAFVNPVPASVVPANTTASSLSGVGGIQGGTGTPPPSGGPVNNSGPSGTHYVSFTVTPNAGFSLDVLALSFDERNLTAVGPTGFDVYTSVDGFTSSILGGALAQSATGFTNHSVALSGPYSAISGPFTVRISGFGGPASAPQGIWLLDNIALTVTAVPEPPTLALLAICAVGLMRRRHSRRSVPLV